MGIFDIFTGAPAKQAGQQSRDFLGQLQGNLTPQINAGTQQGVEALSGGAQRGLTRLDQGFGQGRQDIGGAFGGALDLANLGTDKAAGAYAGGTGAAVDTLQAGGAGARNDVLGGERGALGALRSNTGAAAGAFGAAGGAYQPLADLGIKYGTGADAYSDALGLNGPQGTANATARFQTSPGYQFQVDQALQGVNRAANASGMLASGNTLQALSDRAGQVANLEWGNYLNRLQGYQPLQLNATQGAAAGRAGALRDLGGLYTTEGGREADTITGASRSAADIGTRTAGSIADTLRGGSAQLGGLFEGSGQFGANLLGKEGLSLADLGARGATTGAGIETGTGRDIASTIGSGVGQQVGLAQNLAAPYNKTFGDEASAAQAGSGNLWNLGLNLAKLGVGAYGGLPGFGGGGISYAGAAAPYG